MRGRLTRGVAAAAVIAAMAPTTVSEQDAHGRAAAEEAGPSAAAKGANGSGKRPIATVQRTRYGVPHIRARGWKGAGFGYAYAFAEDNVCTIADAYVTVSAQRSRYFGPDGRWRFSGNGVEVSNLDADFFYARVNDSGIVEDLMRRPPPHGPSPVLRKVVRGYVAGYNAYLRDVGVDGIPDPRCRGAEWVRPITELDVYRRFHQLGSLASSGAAIEGIATAAPVLGGLGLRRAERAQVRALDALKRGETPGFFPIESGSNAIGLGARATRNGLGMVLGNPHFPWDGAERLYQAHVTIPGKLDVSGASLYGVPAALIGHTRGLAWSHTVATAWRFTPFELTLVPGDPRSYVVDGQVRRMRPRELTVQVREPDGSLGTRTRTLYETEYGPMVTSILGLPLFPWTPLKAYALADVNSENFRYLNHFLATNRAQSVRAYDRIQRRLQGIPWVNSIAADRKGNAFYSMDGAVPNVPDEKATGCAGVLGAAIFPLTGIPILDGSRSACGWDDDPDAAAKGIFGPDALPRLIRRDYVTNGNDSHWLSNPRQPLEGYERVIGDERTPRSLRTRVGLLMVEQRLAGTDGLPGKRFSLRTLARVALSNRQYAAELWRDELVDLCRSRPVLVGTAGPVDVSEACPVLAAWNLRNDLDAPGAVLFQRFAERLFGTLPGLPTGVSSGNPLLSEALFDVGFDPADPVETPRGLNTLNPQVGIALADAVTDLRAAGIPPAATLRDYQYEERGGKRVAIHGGHGGAGVFNAIGSTWDPQRGYADVPHGTSYIAAMGFARRGCPARQLSFVTYGQSENQRSPHAADYTRAFSRKRWNRVPFCAKQVRRAAISTKRLYRR